MILTKTMLQQIEVCVNNYVEREGFYYGNRAQFMKRHEKIKLWLAEQLNAHGGEGPTGCMEDGDELSYALRKLRQKVFALGQEIERLR